MNKKLNETIKEIQNDTGFWEKIKASGRLVKAYLTKQYKPESPGRILFYLIAIAYAISPLDFVPEVAAGPIGLIDDAAILLWSWSRITKEIYKFIAWENAKNPYPNADVIDAEIIE